MSQVFGLMQLSLSLDYINNLSYIVKLECLFKKYTTLGQTFIYKAIIFFNNLAINSQVNLGIKW